MIASLWGSEGSGKSSVALSYPRPIFHLDLDLGGFDRAIWRLEMLAEKANKPLNIIRLEPGQDVNSADWENADIVSKPYLAPVQLDKLMGIPDTATGVSVRFPRQVVGIKQIWQQVVIDIVAVGQTPSVKSIILDSATQLWWLCHTGFLQEKQEIQIANGTPPEHPKFRERLQPMEFPNDRMRDLIYTVRSMGKHLVMTHYPRDVYKERVGPNGVESYKSGEVAPDGFKHTVTLDDIVIWCFTEIDKERKIADGEDIIDNPNYNKPQPHAQISLKCGLSGLGMAAVGMELPEPTYEGLMQLQRMAKGEE